MTIVYLVLTTKQKWELKREEKKNKSYIYFETGPKWNCLSKWRENRKWRNCEINDTYTREKNKANLWWLEKSNRGKNATEIDNFGQWNRIDAKRNDTRCT